MPGFRYEYIFASLLDWWRGDCGIMFEGEEMPGQREQRKTMGVLEGLSGDEIEQAISGMTSERWFSSIGEKPEEFRDWLRALRESERG